ncbi:hypothetical protein T4E_7552 [Trichinella pseudospiralis]|uniref:Uncharacterized protein n=1 Tax=Trichinella pseudospiralis TaxID=6337 RepID=A0A0V0Y8G7_TRIPS|nr:hypothetical protein T4E_7552 [Trichinella pseudospiralis]
MLAIEIDEQPLFGELIATAPGIGNASAAAPYTVKKIDANSASHNRTPVFLSPLLHSNITHTHIHTLDSHAKPIE